MDGRKQWCLDIRIKSNDCIIAEFTQNWLEDNINDDLYKAGIETSDKFKNREEFESNVVGTFSGYLENRKTIFETQLDKLKVEEEN